MSIGQKIKAIYHNGVLELLEPLSLHENEHVVITVESKDQKCSEDILTLANRVYEGFNAQDIKDVEAIALDRRRFFRESIL